VSDAPIVLNGRAAARGRITGVERLAREIVPRLAALRPDGYRVIAPARGGSRAALQIWEQTVLPARAARMRTPLIYSPANLAPLAWPRNVLVLHDASVWRASSSFSAAYNAWHGVIEQRIATHALKVITVSEFSKRELIEVVGLDPERIAVVPNGVGAEFRPDADSEPVRRRYGLERPYVLTVASTQARKNLPLLGPLSERLAGEGVDVVWAGGPAETAVPWGGSVRALGHVPDADLPGLYTGAAVFLLPSSYEGFGIPCLEAMAAGTPVVAADLSALPETCGDAALLVDPFDEDALCGAVLSAATDPSVAASLRERGLVRAAQFSWKRAAQQTDSVLLAEARAGERAHVG
jgi:glycosyltransferase involved in cell wall biosynthesis